jgi:hypothetical protein
VLVYFTEVFPANGAALRETFLPFFKSRCYVGRKDSMIRKPQKARHNEYEEEGRKEQYSGSVMF